MTAEPAQPRHAPTAAPTAAPAATPAASSGPEAAPMRCPWGDVAPRLAEITDRVLFDEVWRRPGLSPRDRSLVTVACLVALYRVNELPFHLETALANGVTPDEIAETLTHLAFYAGWPAAGTAVGIARTVLARTVLARAGATPEAAA